MRLGGFNMTLDKKRAFIINFLYFIIVILIGYVALKYGLVWFLPFILAFAIAFSLRPLILYITKKTKIPYKLVSVIVLLLFFAIVGVLIFFIFMRVFVLLRDLFYHMPDIYKFNIEPSFMILLGKIESIASDFSPDIVKGVEELAPNIMESIGSMVTSISSLSLIFVKDVASSIPGIFIGMIFTIISTVFLTLDFEKITAFIMRQFSPKVKSIIYDIKEYMIGSLFKLIKAYAMLMALTFLELSIGLSILKLENAIAIAALIAIIDILPVLGTGGILVPWAIIELIRGDIFFGAGLLILYLVITIVRNSLEPKLVGEQIGLHPLATLMSMFVGAKLLGVLGIFLFPIMAITLVKLNASKKLQLFK